MLGAIAVIFTLFAGWVSVEEFQNKKSKESVLFLLIVPVNFLFAESFYEETLRSARVRDESFTLFFVLLAGWAIFALVDTWTTHIENL